MTTNIVSDVGDYAVWDSVSWPYPRVFFLDYYVVGISTYGSSGLVIHELYNDDDVWYSYALNIADGVFAGISPKDYVDQIEITDFGPFYAISFFGFNGTTPIITSYIRNPGDDISPQVTSLPLVSAPSFISGCNFNGQAVVCGIKETSGDSYWCSLGLSGVAWSRIGSFEFRPTHENFGNQFPNETAGYCHTPWKDWKMGVNYKVKKLGNKVIVYGSGGVVALYPVSSPVVTFGQQQLEMSGIPSGRHVAGDDFVHCIVDYNNDLWLMRENEAPRNLGYREWFTSLLSTGTLICNYSPTTRKFYFSNGVECYVLNEHGMYTTDQLVTSVGNYRGINCAFFDDGADPYIRLTTDRNCFGHRSLKTIEIVEFIGDYYLSTNKMYGSIDYQYTYNTTESFNSTGWQELNERGYMTQKVTASDFRFKLRAPSYKSAYFNLHDIIIGVKHCDRRAIRGPFDVNQASSESSF